MTLFYLILAVVCFIVWAVLSIQIKAEKKKTGAQMNTSAGQLASEGYNITHTCMVTGMALMLDSTRGKWFLKSSDEAVPIVYADASNFVEYGVEYAFAEKKNRASQPFGLRSPTDRERIYQLFTPPAKKMFCGVLRFTLVTNHPDIQTFTLTLVGIETKTSEKYYLDGVGSLRDLCLFFDAVESCRSVAAGA